MTIGSSVNFGQIQTPLLFAARLPARLNAAQAAVLIGCQEHDVSVIVRAKLLRPLGAPTMNAVKYFSSAKLLEACADENWLGRVTKAISESRKKSGKSTNEKWGEEGSRASSAP